MEKRAVLAIVLSLVVVVLWSIFLRQRRLHLPSEVSEPASSPSEPPLALGLPSQQPQSARRPVSPTAPTSERLARGSPCPGSVGDR